MITSHTALLLQTKVVAIFSCMYKTKNVSKFSLNLFYVCYYCHIEIFQMFEKCESETKNEERVKKDENEKNV